MSIVDMHFHTTFSDWKRTNKEVLEEAKRRDIKLLISLEHDIINIELIKLLKEHWIDSFEWTEISARDEIGKKSLHIWCYSKKISDEIKEIIKGVREWRRGKIWGQVELLESSWFKIDYANFTNYYEKKNVNLDNLNNSHIQEYILKNENNLELIKEIAWKWYNTETFIPDFLKKWWKYCKYWFREVERYEPSLKKLWEITKKTNDFLSLVHPNFTFENDINWFYKFIENYKDTIHWIEINSKASKEWVQIIKETALKYDLILTFWSDSHDFTDDKRHWNLWDMNEYIDEEEVNENIYRFKKFINK